MIYFALDFPARRYHATPWGHHVNEGLVEWPADISAAERGLLARLLDRLAYLGRAESRVKASVVAGPDGLPRGALVSTQRRNEDDEPVRLLAPVSSAAYSAWRRGVARCAE